MKAKRPDISLLAMDWITKQEASVMLKCTTRTIKNYMDKGLLDWNRVGTHSVRISMRSVERLLQGLPNSN